MQMLQSFGTKPTNMPSVQKTNGCISLARRRSVLSSTCSKLSALGKSHESSYGCLSTRQNHVLCSQEKRLIATSCDSNKNTKNPRHEVFFHILEGLTHWISFIGVWNATPRPKTVLQASAFVHRQATIMVPAGPWLRWCLVLPVNIRFIKFYSILMLFTYCHDFEFFNIFVHDSETNVDTHLEQFRALNAEWCDLLGVTTDRVAMHGWVRWYQVTRRGCEAAVWHDLAVLADP